MVRLSPAALAPCRSELLSHRALDYNMAVVRLGCQAERVGSALRRSADVPARED